MPLLAQANGTDPVSVGSLVVTAIGFAITIWQLLRTANASEATRRAVERTEKRMALNHLLVLLPQFRLLENDLDAAASDDDRKLAIRALVAWSHVSSEVAGLLRHQDGVEDSLTVKLSESARNAARAKGRLINEPQRPTKSVTREFREELAELTASLAALVSHFRIEAGRA